MNHSFIILIEFIIAIILIFCVIFYRNKNIYVEDLLSAYKINQNVKKFKNSSSTYSKYIKIINDDLNLSQITITDKLKIDDSINIHNARHAIVYINDNKKLVCDHKVTTRMNTLKMNKISSENLQINQLGVNQISNTLTMLISNVNNDVSYVQQMNVTIPDINEELVLTKKIDRFVFYRQSGNVRFRLYDQFNADDINFAQFRNTMQNLYFTPISLVEHKTKALGFDNNSQRYYSYNLTKIFKPTTDASIYIYKNDVLQSETIEIIKNILFNAFQILTECLVEYSLLIFEYDIINDLSSDSKERFYLSTYENKLDFSKLSYSTNSLIEEGGKSTFLLIDNDTERISHSKYYINLTAGNVNDMLTLSSDGVLLLKPNNVALQNLQLSKNLHVIQIDKVTSTFIDTVIDELKSTDRVTYIFGLDEKNNLSKSKRVPYFLHFKTSSEKSLLYHDYRNNVISTLPIDLTAKNKLSNSNILIVKKNSNIVTLESLEDLILNYNFNNKIQLHKLVNFQNAEIYLVCFDQNKFVKGPKLNFKKPTYTRQKYILLLKNEFYPHRIQEYKYFLPRTTQLSNFLCTFQKNELQIWQTNKNLKYELSKRYYFLTYDGQNQLIKFINLFTTETLDKKNILCINNDEYHIQSIDQIYNKNILKYDYGINKLSINICKNKDVDTLIIFNNNKKNFLSYKPELVVLGLKILCINKEGEINFKNLEINKSMFIMGFDQQTNIFRWCQNNLYTLTYLVNYVANTNKMRVLPTFSENERQIYLTEDNYDLPEAPKLTAFENYNLVWVNDLKRLKWEYLYDYKALLGYDAVLLYKDNKFVWIPIRKKTSRYELGQTIPLSYHFETFIPVIARLFALQQTILLINTTFVVNVPRYNNTFVKINCKCKNDDERQIIPIFYTTEQLNAIFIYEVSTLGEITIEFSVQILDKDKRNRSLHANLSNIMFTITAM